MSLTVSVLCIIISFIVGFIVSSFYNKYQNENRYDNIKKIAHLETSATIETQIKDGVQEYKLTEEFNSIKEIEYRKGIEEGEKRTLSRFSLTYEPFVEVRDTLLKRTAEVGYIMQMTYSGFLIGDPMKRVTQHEEKFKDENVKYLVDSVNGILNNIMLVADPLGIPVKVNKTPKIEKKKKGK
ncbi:hypothetical protein DFQ01_109127 [Paenibacillus cellulosilyticus]|uniref:Uncharacterized protein n=1 Tax=Paenibacillus cellulosilyticus TaxID=375489 RepID=A0A2V2YT47_9BACL|nr:hypothetical protein [Paenibacillus cellulosilyticus]PWW02502.1 hypothetical protein DFQ01_109127 [Paenibacillus cellulosilyticus]QKS47204.1 hypothetical protein HUB94_22450 [Paenibacillus cellulosilyticus]